MNKYQELNKRRIEVISVLKRDYINEQEYLRQYYLSYIICPWCEKEIRITYKNHFKNHYRT